jgi:hypothetical protein
MVVKSGVVFEMGRSEDAFLYEHKVVSGYCRDCDCGDRYRCRTSQIAEDRFARYCPYLAIVPAGSGHVTFFLLGGAALGWVSIRFLGEQNSQRTDQIKLAEYRQVNLPGQPVYEQVDSGGYTRLTIYAKAAAPQASTVDIRVIGDDNQPGKQASMVFQAGFAAWTRVDEPITAQHLTFIVGDTGTGTSKATQADVLVFLSKW